jgi:hypothetical protein
MSKLERLLGFECLGCSCDGKHIGDTLFIGDFLLNFLSVLQKFKHYLLLNSFLFESIVFPVVLVHIHKNICCKNS